MLLNKRLPIRYLIRKVRVELIVIILYAALIEVLDEIMGVKGISIPISVPAILGTAISLILSFRTAQAYERWWEARKIWGAIVNDSRTLVRQAVYFSGGDKDMAKVFAKKQVAWCYSLGCRLRELDPHERLERYLNPEELQYVSKTSNIPNAILDLIGLDLSQVLEKEKINPFQQMRMDQTLSRLTDSMGMCERIKNTVFPKIYSLYIQFALWLFIFMVPFGFLELVGWIEGLLLIALAVPFILLEKSANLMQDPFENLPTDTPVFTIAETIKVNLLQMVDETDFKVNDYTYGYYSM
jgi:putative membrane protein